LCNCQGRVGVTARVLVVACQGMQECMHGYQGGLCWFVLEAVWAMRICVILRLDLEKIKVPLKGHGGADSVYQTRFLF